MPDAVSGTTLSEGRSLISPIGSVKFVSYKCSIDVFLVSRSFCEFLASSRAFKRRQEVVLALSGVADYI